VQAYSVRKKVMNDYLVREGAWKKATEGKALMHAVSTSEPATVNECQRTVRS
jgi:hypothetical protein